ncbi:MAG TPA: class I SAM-dependent methyltransferase [Anaerolineae bacterium]|nr:class I SAM-dependent methyltransferase [Anaerolineae bacterium]
MAKSLALMGPLALGAAEIDLEAGDGLDGPSGGVSIHWVSDTQLIEVSAAHLDPVRAATRANAERHGLHIEGLVQEISQLAVPAARFDVVWLSAAMYSCVPTRKR